MPSACFPRRQLPKGPECGRRKGDTLGCIRGARGYPLETQQGDGSYSTGYHFQLDYCPIRSAVGAPSMTVTFPW